MQRHGCSIERVHDLVALRVVLSPEGSNRQPGSKMSPRARTSLDTRADEDADTDRANTAEELSDDDAEERAICYHVLGKARALVA
eukprot:scaffold327383_cov59-Tisochrysis_lutea.AAC.1